MPPPRRHRADDEDYYYARPGYDLGSIATLTELGRAVRVPKRAFAPGFHIPKKPRVQR
ncbi:MAG TPA: hypothetical protein VG407_12635 [Caulobacteraceae bacterium]|jgi:hypothetical protein|nr:hypothetical protein [Caulobacteraceae bacterium]